MKSLSTNPQVQKEMALDSVGPSRGSRIGSWGRPKERPTELGGPDLKGRLWGPAGEVF